MLFSSCGVLRVFSKSKRPVQAKVTIQLATDSAVPVPLSICGVHISSGSSPTLTVAYGSLSRAVFERLVSDIE